MQGPALVTVRAYHDGAELPQLRKTLALDGSGEFRYVVRVQNPMAGIVFKISNGGGNGTGQSPAPILLKGLSLYVHREQHSVHDLEPRVLGVPHQGAVSFDFLSAGGG